MQATMTNIYHNPSKAEWPQLLRRPVLDTTALEGTVSSILTEVKARGDAAVKEYTARFDGAALQDLKVSPAEMATAAQQVDEQLKAAIRVAQQNIERFHTAQREAVQRIDTMPGVTCWRKSVPIQQVGLYIPGGTAPLFSTLLMLGIPARLAGCRQIVVCTPCNKEGQVNPVVLYVAQQLGLTEVYKVGGVQAIAAMAYGTETIPQVYKIFGPGNQYVTCAKQLVNKEGLAIDMPAGPSEVAVYADETANPAFVAADLLSQAEHGADSQVLLVAASAAIIEQVQAELAQQLTVLPRQEMAAQALANSRLVVMEDVATAFDLLNDYAPEHLIIAAEGAEALAERVVNAGSVFLGHWAPESVGDYASGTNHTLPTNGYAKAYSGVSLDSFLKKITFQQLTEEGLRQIGPAVEAMAEAEGLQAHKQAVTVRLAEVR
jgi:histidinol dehydrogenase